MLLRRGLVGLSGPDAESFMQGVVTTNLHKLAPLSASPGLFLNAKGRVLFDVMIYRAAHDSFLLDCHNAPPLAQYLKVFKLRKKVEIVDLSSSHRPLAVEAKSLNHPAKDALCSFIDPRPGLDLLRRIWMPVSSLPSELQDDSLFHQLRFAQGVPEGPEETGEETAFVLNCDWWPGCLSYDKGCYTGQELVARTHFKGQVRKRVVPCILNGGSGGRPHALLPDYASTLLSSRDLSHVSTGAEVMALESGEAVGKLLARSGALERPWLGLMTVRDSSPVIYADKFVATHRVGDVEVMAVRPSWWPSDSTL